MMRNTTANRFALVITLALTCFSAHAGKTLDQIRQRGQLNCGVSTGIAGFSEPNALGTDWKGLDADVCRAVAAAVLGDAAKVKWVKLTTAERITALQKGDIDVLARSTTWTLSRDAAGIHFVGVTFYDGQSFMVPAKAAITGPKQLKGARVCVQSSSTSEKNLSDFSRTHSLGIVPVLFDKRDAAAGAYFSGKCEALTDDSAGLAASRSAGSLAPGEHVILQEAISKEPLGPAVRGGDDEWFTIVKWVIFGLVEAEERGLTKANVDQISSTSKDSGVMRLVGTADDAGKALGLDKEWLRRAVRSVGNYGEMFDRNVGLKTPLALSRGLNRLWNDGGLMYAPPVR